MENGHLVDIDNTTYKGYVRVSVRYIEWEPYEMFGQFGVNQHRYLRLGVVYSHGVFFNWEFLYWLYKKLFIANPATSNKIRNLQIIFIIPKYYVINLKYNTFDFSIHTLGQYII